jgi:hypothetical protein
MIYVFALFVLSFLLLLFFSVIIVCFKLIIFDGELGFNIIENSNEIINSFIVLFYCNSHKY